MKDFTDSTRDYPSSSTRQQDTNVGGHVLVLQDSSEKFMSFILNFGLLTARITLFFIFAWRLHPKSREGKDMPFNHSFSGATRRRKREGQQNPKRRLLFLFF